MIKKIKIISLICISVLACGKDKSKDNAPESLINVNDSPRKILKTYIKSLRAQYNDDWHKILSALERDGVWELDYEDKKILLNNRANIERDLKGDQNLLNYFYRLLQTSSLEPSHDRDTLKFTTEKARLKQELYDDMANVADAILKLQCPIFAEVEAMYSVFFSNKEEQKKFFEDKDRINWFGKDPANKDPFDFERYPLISDPEKYKIWGDELNEQIWKNFISIVKNVQPIRDDQMDSLRKDRYVYDEQLGFPITSGTEDAIVRMCKRFGIHYNADFTSVVCSSKDHQSRQQLEFFCLTFFTYVLRKFVKEFCFEGEQGSLKCYNSCGLLSFHSPFCFLGHQIIGLIWAIMNTALISFPIEKINTSTEKLCLDLGGLFNVEMARPQIKLAVRNSLFAGVGFYYNGEDKEEKDVENHIEEWGKGIDISQDDFVEMNGFATMDYRYVIDFTRYDCFDIGASGKKWEDLKDITDSVWITIKAPPQKTPTEKLKNTLFAKDGLQPDVSFDKRNVNFIAASFAALHSMTSSDPKGSKIFGFYFFDFEKFEKLGGCLSKFSTLEEFSTEVADASPTDFNKSPWKNICLRKRESQEDLQLYSKWHKDILGPLYKEYVQKHKGSEGYLLKSCAKIDAVKQANFVGDDQAKQNYFFTIIFRTYEAIGTYCLFDNILQTRSWSIKYEKEN